MVTGAGEHADSVDHAFENGHSNKYTSFNSQGEPDKSTYKQDGKDDKELDASSDSPKTRHDESGEALHDAHPLASMSPFEKEKFKDLKEAKATGDEEGVEKAKKALEDLGFDTSKLDVHEDDQPKTGPPNPEVAKRKMAEGYVWHEETRHWILKETLDDLHGGHGSAQLGNTASIVDAGHQGAEGGGAFALDEHGNAAGSQFVLHGGGKLHQIGSGETPKGAAHYSQITGNSLKHHLGDTLDGHNAKGGGVTKLKGFDSKSGKLTDNIQYGKGFVGQMAQEYTAGKAKRDSSAKFFGGRKMPSKRKIAAKTALAVATGGASLAAEAVLRNKPSKSKIAATLATAGGYLAGEAAWKKFKPILIEAATDPELRRIREAEAKKAKRKAQGKLKKSEASALDLFIKEYSPQDVMSTRDLLEYVSKPKPKKVESGYNKEREETHV
jgi:hypothetical protein